MSWWKIINEVTFVLKVHMCVCLSGWICAGLLIMKKDVWSLEMIRRKVAWHNGVPDKKYWWITFWWLTWIVTEIDGWSMPYEAKGWIFLSIKIHDIEERNSSWAAQCLTIATTGSWLRGILVVSFLLGRNLKYVLPELRGSDVCDSLIHVSCIRPGLTTVSLSEVHAERMDIHIILVFT